MNPSAFEAPLSSTVLRRRLLGVVAALAAAPALASPHKNSKAPAAKAAPVKGKAAPAPARGVRGHGAAAAAPAAPPPRIVQREPALVPRLTSAAPEGPHYLEAAPMRPDISDGQPGVPLELRFVVVDQTALPFAGALVDVWHCDARGVYSGFAGQGEQGDIDARGRNFLRGRQATDRNGVAAFRTLYPGWHPGRTAHIHFKVWNGERCVLTSQLFLPDALSEYLYTQQDAYRRATLRDTLNSSDAIALQAGNSVVGSVREEREQYVLTLAVAVDRSGAARPAGDGAPEAAAPAAASPGRFDQDSPARRQALVPGVRG